MALWNQRQARDFAPGRQLRQMGVAALLAAILSLTSIHPTRAQDPTPALTDAHSTLSPAEAQHALDVLQDAAKRDELVQTLRTIVKVSPPPPARPTAPGEQPPMAADGLGANALLLASTEIGDLSAQIKQSVRAATTRSKGRR